MFEIQGKQKRFLGARFMHQKVLYYLGSEQQRCWSDCMDAQSDLRLCCSHMASDTFSYGLAQINYSVLPTRKQTLPFCLPVVLSLYLPANKTYSMPTRSQNLQFAYQ